MIHRSLLRYSYTSRPVLRSLSTPSRAHSVIPSLRICTFPLPKRIASKCYSTTTDTIPDAVESPSTGQQQQLQQEAELKDEDPVKNDLEAKEREIIDLKDRYLRSVADYRNLQDRAKRDVQSARDFAISRFATDLVESIDNLDRALLTVPAETLAREDGGGKDLKGLHEGLKMTESILMQTLKKHGLERFDPSVEGEMFDPRLHEATFQMKMEGREDGEVFATQQKGFMLNGRVLRAAKVGVVKNS